VRESGMGRHERWEGAASVWRGARASGGGAQSIQNQKAYVAF
jgi:hypothetical protein